MRTTVDLPDLLLLRAKKRAAERGESLRQMIIRGLERELGRRITGPLVPTKGKPGSLRILNARIEGILSI